MKSLPAKRLGMKRGKYVPDRGEIVWLYFAPQTGHEQNGRRPALVLSPRDYNAKTSLCLCVPITSKIKGYPFEVILPEGLPVHGAILSDQIKSLDFVIRQARPIGHLPVSLLKKVQMYAGALVGGV